MRAYFGTVPVTVLTLFTFQGEDLATIEYEDKSQETIVSTALTSTPCFVLNI